MSILAFDVETVDPYIKKSFSGAMRPDSKLLTICAYDGDRGYPDISFEELEKLIDKAEWIVGANIQYDLSYITHKFNYKFKDKKIVDILAIERLLDTTSLRMNLEVLAQKYEGKSKLTDALEEYANANGIKKVMENLDKVPKRLLVTYCVQDCILSYDVFVKQLEQLKDQPGFKEEVGIQGVLYKMLNRGIPFDEDVSNEVRDKLDATMKIYAKEIQAKFGTTNFSTHAGKETLADYCDEKGYEYKLTEKTEKPSFDKNFYARYGDIEDIHKIERYKTLTKLKKDFVLKPAQYSYQGKMYPNINSMKGEQGGAVTGRFSMQKINLQQTPSRDPDWAKLIRSQFRAPEGYTWIKADYSQQEVRMLLHLAAKTGGKGTQELVERYQKDPKMDSYLLAVEISEKQGFEISRSTAKQLLLATMYCMGAGKLSSQLLCSEEEAQDILYKFRRVFPFLRDFQYSIIGRLEDQGRRDHEAYVRTITGRRIWLPVIKKETLAGNVYITDKAYRGINYTVQGSSADVTKKAMLNLHDKYGIVPVSSIHDEINVLALDEEVEETIEKIRDSMENTYDLLIPMIADIETGQSWGEVK